ncbi:MAG: DHH family phosphoesterase [Thermoplasmatota archaeon]
MYLLIGKSKLKSNLEASLQSRNIDSHMIDDIVLSELKNIINEKENKIDGVIFLYPEENEIGNIVKAIKDEDRNIDTIIVCDSDYDIHNEGIDVLIDKKNCLENSILKNIENIEFRKRSRELFNILSKDNQKISIFIHNNPDPDAIASAMALEKLCDYLGLESTTYYGGHIGHPENQAFLNNTGFIIKNVDMDEAKDVVKRSDVIAFLDFAEASSNNIVPKDVSPDIIIDHHYTNRRINAESFSEIRTDIGATSTLMAKHLQNLRINIDSLLATALLYGIKVDTHDYSKNISTADFKVIAYLTALADKELLDIFESPPMKSETLSALGRAINSRDLDDGVLTAFAGHIAYKDDIPQIAELLMGERDVMSVLVFGILKDKLHLSARSKDMTKNIGKIMKDAFTDIGSAGGHRHSAGGEISLDTFESKEKAKIDITRRFKREMNKK